jgi:hypothetical protein
MKPWRTQVYPAKRVEYIGTADLDSYTETREYVRSMAPRVRWEDIDPDSDPLMPCKPTFRYEQWGNDLDDGLFFFDERPYVEFKRRGKAKPPMSYEELQEDLKKYREPPVLKPKKIKMVSLTQYNYDRLERISHRLRFQESDFIGWDDCWICYESRVYLKHGAKQYQFRPAVGIWLLEFGEPIPVDFKLKRLCSEYYCVRPSHHQPVED